MSYEIKVGSKTIIDTFYTLTPVNCVLRIFVLSNFKRQKNQIVQCWSWTATSIVLTVMLLLTLICLVLKVQRFEENFYGEIRFTNSLQLTYLLGFAEYILDLLFVYKMRHSCVKYLQFYTNIDKVLGFPNYLRIREKNLTAVLLMSFSFIVSSLFDYVSWFFAFGFMIPTLYCLDYMFGFINALTALDVVSNLIQIEYRVKVILSHIEEYYASLALNHDVDIDYETVEKQKVDKLKTVSYSKSLGILSLSKCYVMLMEQVNFINMAFGVRLVAFCLNILIYLIHLVNIFIRTMIGQFMLASTERHLTAASTVLRIVNYAGVLFVLVYRCEQTYKLCCTIIRLIDLTVVSKEIPVEMKTALVELRSLVLSRPVRFHGANFFTLDYPLLVSVASIVVTYSIILLQGMR